MQKSILKSKTTQFKVGDRIRHFKGGEYVIVSRWITNELAEGETIVLRSFGVGIVCRSATDIPSGTECFLYQSVETDQYWIRPCSEFGELITRPRFQVVMGES